MCYHFKESLLKIQQELSFAPTKLNCSIGHELSTVRGRCTAVMGKRQHHPLDTMCFSFVDVKLGVSFCGMVRRQSCVFVGTTEV